ncbi:hypothetical protein JCM16358_01830 [Halanaerocella petrolearia]
MNYPSTSSDPIAYHSHIHCWHTNDIFSKFEFETGSYNDISTENLDIDRVKNYCLYMALQSKE